MSARGGVRDKVRGEYRVSSLVKQNKKAKICFVIYITGFFFQTVEYDHGTLYADVTSQLIQQPRKAKKSKRVKRVDWKKWEEEAEEWANRVRSRGLETSKGRGSEVREEKGMISLTEEEVRWELKRWIAIARAELPRKEMHIGGEKARRKGMHYSKEQTLLTRQVKELERELIRSNSKTQGDDRVKRASKQIAQWIGGSGEKDIALPERWDAEGRREWIGIVNREADKRKQTLKKLKKEQQKELIREM